MQTTAPNFTTRPLAEAYLAANDFVEIGIATWSNGTHIASIRPVQVYALHVQEAPIVAVDVELVGVRQ